ncbi:crossover junction endodeoxyribonuclease RuvC-like [Ylistrum balloti]|uniref:crossover junction endodeoxyribonuclease RuvC-like n=1 Tax=Ylistrum balloti TaxID=509963 RepID=UPI002905CA0A|nr:crossover junction endodeoxyribonuclease RuvC-like [Ylistrum balloti]
MIIGIDPGFATIGYAFIAPSNNEPRIVDLGMIVTDKKKNFYDRLTEIEENLHQLLDRHLPSIKHIDCDAVVEKIFFMKNKKTAIEVAHARGVICNLFNKRGIRIFEYTPNEIKKAITGHGQSSKKEIQSMVIRLLNLKTPISQDDIADALAMTICHWFYQEKNWGSQPMKSFPNH